MNLNFTLTKVLQLLATTATIAGCLHTHGFSSPVNMKAMREEGRRRRRRGVTDGLRNGAVEQDSTRSSSHPLNQTPFDPVVGFCPLAPLLHKHFFILELVQMALSQGQDCVRKQVNSMTMQEKREQTSYGLQPYNPKLGFH